MYLFIFLTDHHNQFRACQARPHAAENSCGVSLLEPVLRAENDRC